MSQIGNLMYLKYFYDTARTGSISKAAQENYVSQSAVSQAIRKLEQQTKKALITHTRGRTQLSSEGHLLYESCQRIFGELSRLQDRLASPDAELSGPMRMACSHSVALALLPRAIQIFLKQAPTSKPQIYFGHSHRAMDWVRRAVVDVAIVWDNEDLSEFSATHLYSGQFHLYRHPQLNIDEKTLYLTAEDRPEQRKLHAAFYRKYRAKIPVCMEISSWEVIAELTAQQVGIGFLPDFIQKFSTSKHHLSIVEYNLEPITYQLFGISRVDEPLSRAHHAFLNALKTTLEN